MSDQENKDPKNQQISIELKEEVAQGVYSNLAIINHSSSEFVVDFVRVVPGVNKAQVKSRIILTPEHAKRFMRALQDNIDKYEQMHGKIKQGEQGNAGMPPMNFGGPTAQA